MTRTKSISIAAVIAVMTAIPAVAAGSSGSSGGSTGGSTGGASAGSTGTGAAGTSVAPSMTQTAPSSTAGTTLSNTPTSPTGAPSTSGGLVPVPGQSFGSVGVSTVPQPGNSFGITSPTTGSDQPAPGRSAGQGLDPSSGNMAAQSANIPGVGQTPGQGYRAGTSGVNSPLTTGSITPGTTYTNPRGGSARAIPTKAQCAKPYISTYVWSETEFHRLCETTGGR